LILFWFGHGQSLAEIRIIVTSNQRWWPKNCCRAAVTGSGLREYAVATQTDRHPIYRTHGSFLDAHHLALASNGRAACPRRKSEDELQFTSCSGCKIRIEEDAFAVHVPYHPNMSVRVAGLKLNPDWKTDESTLFPAPIRLGSGHDSFGGRIM